MKFSAVVFSFAAASGVAQADVYRNDTGLANSTARYTYQNSTTALNSTVRAVNTTKRSTSANHKVWANIYANLHANETNHSVNISARAVNVTLPVVNVTSKAANETIARAKRQAGTWKL